MYMCVSIAEYVFYVCVHVYIHLCIHVYIYVCTHLFILVFACAHLCFCMYIYILTFVNVHVYISICEHVYVYVQTDVYVMYMYMHIFMCGHDRLCPGTVTQHELFLLYMASCWIYCNSNENSK